MDKNSSPGELLEAAMSKQKDLTWPNITKGYGKEWIKIVHPVNF